MKKFVCVLVLACVIMGGVFAQANNAKNSIGLDVFRFLDRFLYFGSGSIYGTTLSVSYERLLVPHWSLGPDVDIGLWYGGGNVGFSFAVAAEGRYYPLANFDKLFFGATFGFILNSDYYSGYGLLGGRDTNFGLTMSAKVGYKIQTSKKIYIEPSISYYYQPWFDRIGSGIGSGSLIGDDWRGGLRLGLSF